MITRMHIVLARRILGLGVRELAAEVGITPAALSRHETGQSSMSSDNLQKIETALLSKGLGFSERGITWPEDRDIKLVRKAKGKAKQRSAAL